MTDCGTTNSYRAHEPYFDNRKQTAPTNQIAEIRQRAGRRRGKTSGTRHRSDNQMQVLIAVLGMCLVYLRGGGMCPYNQELIWTKVEQADPMINKKRKLKLGSETHCQA